MQESMRVSVEHFNIEYRLLAEIDSDQVNFITKNTEDGYCKSFCTN